MWQHLPTSVADQVEPQPGQPAPAPGVGGKGPKKRGVWAPGTDHLSLCPGCQAALDFVVEEDLRAHLTCWYIQKYVKENPLPQYLERLQP